MRQESSAVREVTTLVVIRVILSVIFLAFLGYIAVASLSYPSIAGVYPRLAAIVGIILGAITLFLDVREVGRRRRGPADVAAGSLSPLHLDGSDMPVGEALARAIRYFLWLVAFALLVFLIGFVAAAGVFLFAFLAIESTARWPLLVLGPIASMGLLILMAEALGVVWPFSLLSVIPSG